MMSTSYPYPPDLMGPPTIEVDSSIVNPLYCLQTEGSLQELNEVGKGK